MNAHLPVLLVVLGFRQDFVRTVALLNESLVLLRGRARVLPALVPCLRHGCAEQEDEGCRIKSVHDSALRWNRGCCDSHHSHNSPDDYAACFRELAHAGLIPVALGERLERMARFRNLLVHKYWNLDHARVHEIILHDLGDLRDFAAAVARLV